MSQDDIQLVKAGVEAVTSEALKPVRDLISAICGPAAKEAGLMLRDHVRVFRAARQLRLYQRTAEIFEKLGTQPRQVPLKLLFPIIENASVEESDELQDRWANLLANAADPSGRRPVNLSFPIILRELSSQDARFLDALYDDTLAILENSPSKLTQDIYKARMTYSDLFRIFAEKVEGRKFSRDNLSEDLERREAPLIAERLDMSIDILLRHQVMQRAHEFGELEYWEPNYTLTSLGIHFVGACREPATQTEDSSK